MKRALFATALFLGLSTAPALADAPASSTPIIKTDSGPVRGITQGAVQSYLGIPYAAPPVGDLRWNPPHRPKAWKAVLDASKFGDKCPQNADLGAFAKPGGAEDCLTLSVLVPKDAQQSSAKLPVFVWIYGGSLLVGASSDYDAHKLAVEGKAIVVTFNYRLGLLGFFAHPTLDKEGHAFANYGLMDQNFVLDWVQRNIASFGGDPKNVTLAGESSGGTSVFSQIVSPWSAGKFQQAIAMSGSAVIYKFPRFGAPTPLLDAEKMGGNFAKSVDCAATDVKCLRQLPVETILAKQKPYTIVQTIIDGNFLPMSHADAFKSGKFNHVVLIDGGDRDEARFFLGLGESAGGPPMSVKDYAGAIGGYFGKPLGDAALKEYPLEVYNSPSEGWSAAVSDAFFACPARAIDRWVGATTPVYAYEFADQTAPSYLNPTSYPQGAAHTSELAYLFPGFHGGTGNAVSLNAMQAKLSTQMVTTWSHSYQLNAVAADWSKYDAQKDNVMRFSLPAARMTEQSFHAMHHCDFWDKSGIY